MRKLLFLLSIITLTSCSATDNRVKDMQMLTQNSGFEKKIVYTDPFFVFSMYKGQGNTARIYIEGDGFAWKTRRLVSDDPTPRNPVALKMAMRDKSDLVIYIARPCQYSMQYGFGDYCEKDVWSYDRFSADALSSLNQVIDKYKKDFRFKNIELVGFSGGGAMAMLLPSVRKDISKITTVAGNLDIEAWVNHHGILPLTGSLNPADYVKDSIYIPQVHYVGKKDWIVPPFIAHDFVYGQDNAQVIEKDTDHNHWDFLTIK